MKYWVIYVLHSKVSMNDVSRIQFDQDKEKAFEVARALDAIVIYGEFIDIPKPKKEKNNAATTVLPQV